jgi:hypothetical protein
MIFMGEGGDGDVALVLLVLFIDLGIREFHSAAYDLAFLPQSGRLGLPRL